MIGSPERRPLPRLHLITDDGVLGSAGFMARAQQALEAGGDRIALHLRSPGFTSRALWELASACVAWADRYGSWLLVNDRIDIALACGATGVQLRRSSIPIERARRLLEGAVIGASVHDAGEALAAAAEGADFVVAGTLYETTSHPGRVPAGLALLQTMVDLPIPVIGIGGVTAQRAGDVVAAGAHGVAAIRGVWEAADPGAAVAEYLEKMEVKS